MTSGCPDRLRSQSTSSRPRTPVDELVPPHRRLPLALLLVGAGLVGVLAGMPLQAAIVEGTAVELPVSIAVVLVVQGLQAAVLLALAVLCGFTLGQRVGLGAPVFGALLERRPAGPLLRSALVPAVAIGLGGALAVTALDVVLFSDVVPFIDRPQLPFVAGVARSFVRWHHGGAAGPLRRPEPGRLGRCPVHPRRPGPTGSYGLEAAMVAHLLADVVILPIASAG